MFSLAGSAAFLVAFRAHVPAAEADEAASLLVDSGTALLDRWVGRALARRVAWLLAERAKAWTSGLVPIFRGHKGPGIVPGCLG